jgi:hypothetical protein
MLLGSHEGLSPVQRRIAAHFITFGVAAVVDPYRVNACRVNYVPASPTVKSIMKQAWCVGGLGLTPFGSEACGYCLLKEDGDG